jgi:hypothetical protein
MIGIVLALVPLSDGAIIMVGDITLTRDIIHGELTIHGMHTAIPTPGPMLIMAIILIPTMPVGEVMDMALMVTAMPIARQPIMALAAGLQVLLLTGDSIMKPEG